MSRRTAENVKIFVGGWIHMSSSSGYPVDGVRRFGPHVSSLGGELPTFIISTARTLSQAAVLILRAYLHFRYRQTVQMRTLTQYTLRFSVVQGQPFHGSCPTVLMHTYVFSFHNTYCNRVARCSRGRNGQVAREKLREEPCNRAARCTIRAARYMRDMLCILLYTRGVPAAASACHFVRIESTNIRCSCTRPLAPHK